MRVLVVTGLGMQGGAAGGAGAGALHQMRCVRSPKLKAKGILDPLGQPTSYRADSRAEHDFKASFKKVLPTGERTE